MAKDKDIIKKDEPITIQAIEHAITGDRDVAQAKHYKDAVEAFDPKELVKVITIKDEMSGKTGTYELDRGGTRDQKLAMVLADNNSSDEKKLATMSLWFFERGMNSASFFADLMVHKGTQTRELRQFQSTMRFDFTMFVGLFCSFLRDNAKTILNTVVPGSEPMGVVEDALKYLTDQKAKYDAKQRKEPPTLQEWAEYRYHQVGDPTATAKEESFSIMLLEMGVRYASEAQHMQGEIQQLADDRERARGKYSYPVI